MSLRACRQRRNLRHRRNNNIINNNKTATTGNATSATSQCVHSSRRATFTPSLATSTNGLTLATAPHRTEPHRTVPYRTVPNGTERYRTEPYGTVPNRTVPNRTVPNRTVPPQRATFLSRTPTNLENNNPLTSRCGFAYAWLPLGFRLATRLASSSLLLRCRLAAASLLLRCCFAPSAFLCPPRNPPPLLLQLLPLLASRDDR